MQIVKSCAFCSQPKCNCTTIYKKLCVAPVRRLCFLLIISATTSFDSGNCEKPTVPIPLSAGEPEQFNPASSFQSPYPGYLDALNSTIINLITQLNVYKSYIDQAFKPLQTYDKVFPQRTEDFHNISHSLAQDHLQNKLSAFNKTNIPIPLLNAPGAIDFNLKGELSRLINVTAPKDMPFDVRIGSLFPFPINGNELLNSNKTNTSINGRCGEGLSMVEGENEDHFKWNVAIGPDTQEGFQLTCGGTLIDAQTVISSAHCFDKVKSNTIRLENGVFHNISSVIVHPNYSPQEFYNDIAILKLETPVKVESVDTDEDNDDNSDKSSSFYFNSSYIPCLPPSKEEKFHSDLLRSVSELNKNKKGSQTLSGLTTQWTYGFKNNEIKLVSQIKAVEVISNFECELAYRKHDEGDPINFLTTYFPFGVDSSLVCAKISGHHDCEINYNKTVYIWITWSFLKGNRGHQLVAKLTTSAPFLLGTRTNGLSDCDYLNLPGIYTNIPHFMNWIEGYKS